MRQNAIKKIKISKEGEFEYLTFEQTVAKFEKLIMKESNSFYNEKFANLADVSLEDIIQEANIATWQAFEYYDESLNYCFSTLINSFINKYLNKKFRARVKQKRNGDYNINHLDATLSSSSERGNQEQDEYATLILSDQTNFEEELINSLYLNEIYETFNEREKLYMLALVGRIQQIEIAEYLGISKMAITKGMQVFKEKLKIIFEDLY